MAVIDKGIHPTVLRALKGAGCNPQPAPIPAIKLAMGATVTRAYRSACPACGNRGLSLLLLDDGGALIECHAAGCNGRRAVAVLGLVQYPESPTVRRAALALAKAVGDARRKAVRKVARGAA